MEIGSLGIPRRDRAPKILKRPRTRVTEAIKEITSLKSNLKDHVAKINDDR